jgi:hypothetical protein
VIRVAALLASGSLPKPNAAQHLRLTTRVNTNLNVDPRIADRFGDPEASETMRPAVRVIKI